MTAHTHTYTHTLAYTHIQKYTHTYTLTCTRSSLFSVAKKFLDEVDLGDDCRNAVVEFMPYSFALVNTVSKSEYVFLVCACLWN